MLLLEEIQDSAHFINDRLSHVGDQLFDEDTDYLGFGLSLQPKVCINLFSHKRLVNLI